MGVGVIEGGSLRMDWVRRSEGDSVQWVMPRETIDVSPEAGGKVRAAVRSCEERFEVSPQIDFEGARRNWGTEIVGRLADGWVEL